MNLTRCCVFGCLARHSIQGELEHGQHICWSFVSYYTILVVLLRLSALTIQHLMSNVDYIQENSTCDVTSRNLLEIGPTTWPVCMRFAFARYALMQFNTGEYFKYNFLIHDKYYSLYQYRYWLYLTIKLNKKPEGVKSKIKLTYIEYWIYIQFHLFLIVSIMIILHCFVFSPIGILVWKINHVYLNYLY